MARSLFEKKLKTLFFYTFMYKCAIIKEFAFLKVKKC